MTARSVLSDLALAAERLAATQRKLSSGKELTRPSDDPFAVATAIDLRGELEATRQRRRNAADGLAWSQAADGALSGISDAVQRARELIVRGASDTASPTDRAAIASELDQLIDAIKEQASAGYSGRYLFAGTATSTRPYAAGGSDAYAGDAGSVVREIGPGVSVVISTDLHGVLGDGQSAADGKLLATLRDAAAHLRGGTVADIDALRITDLRAVDANFGELNRVRAAAGSVASRVEAAEGRLAAVEESLMSALSQTEDADVAKVMVDYSTQRAAYEAGLKAGAQIIEPSLLDFLR
jgi:flagellar hook-associated protein 3 FlgL